MPSLWSEVQLTYILIMTVCLGIFRAIDIGLHSRDFHTAQSAHSALVDFGIWRAKEAVNGGRGKDVFKGKANLVAESVQK